MFIDGRGLGDRSKYSRRTDGGGDFLGLLLQAFPAPVYHGLARGHGNVRKQAGNDRYLKGNGPTIGWQR
ncbi:MAG TPA: hypothetical protein VN823_06660, partial [Stellaceae bacterium]|nr:hypothetical protein [Stellaceae bacterium]